MATQPQSFITLVNGRKQVAAVDSIAATAGAADASRLVRTGADGKLDATLLPAGLGADALTFLASEALSGGDYINIWDDAGVAKARKADASAAGKEADGFVLDAALTGASVTVYFEGRNTGHSALTLGARYYLSAATPGAAVSAPPAGAGNVVQYLGRASTANSLVFEATDGVILA